jgi:hypothetical protein
VCVREKELVVKVVKVITKKCRFKRIIRKQMTSLTENVVDRKRAEREREREQGTVEE